MLDGSFDASADAPTDVRADAAEDDAAERPLIVSDAPCDLPDLRTVIVDATDAPDSARLELRYRTFASDLPGAPVVVVVPGGPGQELMADDARRDFALSGVPTNAFSVIYTDARGSGCNAFADIGLPDEDVFTIERVAEDLAAIVRNEALTDYYLYGASFGTAVVTVAAHLMELRGDSPRDFVTVPDAAHAPLTLGLAARGCIEDVWSAIRGDQDLATVLAACERPGESIELVSRTD